MSSTVISRIGCFALPLIVVCGCASPSDTTSTYAQGQGALEGVFSALPSWEVFDRSHPRYGSWTGWSGDGGLTIAQRLTVQDAARRYVERYREDWGSDALAAKEAQALATDVRRPASDQHWVSGFFEFMETLGMSRTLVVSLEHDAPGPADCVADGTVSKPADVLSLFKRLYLGTVAGFRNIGSEYLGLPNRDWDGQPLQQLPLPDGPTIHAQKKRAAELEAAFLAAESSGDFSALPESSISKAKVLLRQLKHASVGWKLGADQLLTPYGAGLWAADVLMMLGPAKMTGEEMLQFANAYFYMNGLANVGAHAEFDIKDLNEGTLIGTFGPIGANGLAEGSAALQVGDVAGVAEYTGTSEDGARIGTRFLHLARWWEERLRAKVDSAASWSRSSTEQENGWDAFTADFELDTSYSFQTFGNELEGRRLERVGEARDHVIEAYSAIDASKASAIRSAVAGHESATDIVASGRSALGASVSVLDERRKTLVFFGGPGSEPGRDQQIADEAWAQVAAYITHAYGALRNPDSSKTLPELMNEVAYKVIPTFRAIEAIASGKGIRLGTNTPVPNNLYTLYSSLFHELFHCFDALSGKPARGHAREGGPMVSELTVFRDFIVWLGTQPHPNGALWHIASDQVALYQVEDDLLSMDFILANWELTHYVVTHEPQGSAAYVLEQAKTKWKLDEGRARRAVVRDHRGYAYLEYPLSEITERRAVDALKALHTTKRVDPYSLFACGVYVPRGVEGHLETCLPNRN